MIKLTNILEEMSLESFSKEHIQSIIDKVYPHIVNDLGKSRYGNKPPKVELHRDIYARLSGEEEAQGEESHSSEAEYDDVENKIFVYYPNMKDEKHIIQSLLHEYTHTLQDPDPNEQEKNRAHGYKNDPNEITAHKAEENWENYLKYL
tara:strand:+ start:1710 stop:2153 length:444 start_codon:yes stop_codon:yes gene_type:complete